MKVLSLTQPWATLVAIGAKKIETRSWKTNYRGPLAIHAAKGFPKSARETAGCDPFNHALVTAGYATAEPQQSLPLGAIVAVCELRDCRLTEWIVGGDGTSGIPWPQFTPEEEAFGDFHAGRFGWLLENVRAMAEPIPAKGALGLWEFDDERLRSEIAA